MTVTRVDAGPRQVRFSACVNASAAELFAIVAPEQLVVGARFSTAMRMFGISGLARVNVKGIHASLGRVVDRFGSTEL